MSETNTNTNGTNGEQNSQQNNANNNNSQQNNNTNQQTNTQQNNNVDVEKVKGDAIAEYLKSLGVENSDSLQAIVKKAKEEEEANKTDLQKKDDALTATTKELVDEREARVIAEAKLSAIQLGAKPELVDVVIVAKAKVTKDKDINAVIAEMKDSTNGKIYFAIGEEDETNKKGTVTRSRVKKTTEQNNQNTNGESNNGDSKYAGTMAERLLAGRKAVKSHYFK